MVRERNEITYGYKYTHSVRVVIFFFTFERGLEKVTFQVMRHKVKLMTY